MAAPHTATAHLRTADLLARCDFARLQPQRHQKLVAELERQELVVRPDIPEAEDVDAA